MLSSKAANPPINPPTTQELSVLPYQRTTAAPAMSTNAVATALIDQLQTWLPCTNTGWRHHRSEEHTSELQSQSNHVCRLLLEKKKKKKRFSFIRQKKKKKKKTKKNTNTQ